MAETVVVTGGAGFIGSHVADRFLAEGWDVTILDDLSSGREENIPSSARFVRGDITTPEAATLIRDGKFDVMCHLAAQIDVRRSVLDPVYDATRNILGTLNLMEAVRAGGHPTRTIFSSTGGALYGDFDPPPSAESNSKDPEAPYGIAKLSIEYYLTSYGRVHGLDNVALRYGNVYGPRQDPHGEAGVVAIFCNRLLDGRALTVFGDGEQTRDYVYVGDVALDEYYRADSWPTIKDKALVENMVKLTYQNIYSNLPDKKILTLSELNAEIRKYLHALNCLPLTGKDCSREQQWQMEKNTLQSLPDTRYEMRKVKQVTVMKNGHVYLTEDQHYYSVPYELIGRKLNMQYARSTVDIFHKYQLVAHHKRVRSRHQYSTEPSHIPPQHRFVTEWSSEFFIEKGRQIDPAVEYYIMQVLAAKRYPPQAYRSCNGILSFAARAGKERLITACKMAHGFGYYNYRTIEDILNRNLDKYEQEEEGKDLPQHENIRGRNYYE